MNCRNISSIATFAVLFICLAFSARGQYQVRQPGDAAQNASGTNAATTQAWDRPVGVELYGNNNNKPSRFGQQTLPLPSETRMAIERSGALPSEVRLNAEAIGPLSPNGAIDYVPPLSPMQAALGVRPPVIWGPAWQRPQTADARVSAMHVPDGVTPTRRPPAVATDPSPLAITQRPLNAQQPMDARIPTAPIDPLYPVNRVVNRPILRGPPTTQPSNRSLAEQFPPQPAEPTTQPAAK